MFHPSRDPSQAAYACTRPRRRNPPHARTLSRNQSRPHPQHRRKKIPSTPATLYDFHPRSVRTIDTTTDVTRLQSPHLRRHHGRVDLRIRNPRHHARNDHRVLARRIVRPPRPFRTLRPRNRRRSRPSLRNRRTVGVLVSRVETTPRRFGDTQSYTQLLGERSDSFLPLEALAQATLLPRHHRERICCPAPRRLFGELGSPFPTSSSP